MDRLPAVGVILAFGLQYSTAGLTHLTGLLLLLTRVSSFDSDADSAREPNSIVHGPNSIVHGPNLTPHAHPVSDSRPPIAVTPHLHPPFSNLHSSEPIHLESAMYSNAARDRSPHNHTPQSYIASIARRLPCRLTPLGGQCISWQSAITASGTMTGPTPKRSPTTNSDDRTMVERTTLWMAWQVALGGVWRMGPASGSFTSIRGGRTKASRGFGVKSFWESKNG
ncbi:hypothetical protein C8R47DRAFT_47731 [Mycena vitilis]|nr:hypothetical protein C8R47DRAFT_47731 [Mycena vitilis]